VGNLDPTAYGNLVHQIENAFPSSASSQSLINSALQQLGKDSGILGIIAILLAIFNGSRLFIFIEGCLDIIYHVRPRGLIAQNVVAVLMVLLFVVIIPLMIVASVGPAFVFSTLKNTPLGNIPGSSIIFSLGGIVGGLIAAYILFQVIYIVVPNQKISFRRSWRGSVVAAVLLEIYLLLFPLFVTHFLGAFSGAISILILLVFFYYFGVILFLGAEVNAFAEGIRETRYDLVTMVYKTSNPNALPARNEVVATSQD
jgi:membrane protein